MAGTKQAVKLIASKTPRKTTIAKTPEKKTSTKKAAKKTRQRVTKRPGQVATSRFKSKCNRLGSWKGYRNLYAIPFVPFARLCREIILDINQQVDLQKDALEVIQESAENFLISVLQVLNTMPSQQTQALDAVEGQGDGKGAE
ncbi:histone [Fusarium longipes]|uniref:Histone n=1 Tax=Fusarium longipes TaxID=694270 RepID=A0A395SXS0_9HYPO|nr:histone [Fusarium longipes]